VSECAKRHFKLHNGRTGYWVVAVHGLTDRDENRAQWEHKISSKDDMVPRMKRALGGQDSSQAHAKYNLNLRNAKLSSDAIVA